MISKARYIENTESLTEDLPLIKYENPDYIYLALTNARCNKGEVYVKEGDYVKIGQVIGIRKSSFFEQNIHSTVSGTVEGIVKKFHRIGKLLDFIKIKNDKLAIYDESIKDRTDDEIARLTKDDFTKIVKDCSIVGLGGSSFPTYVKFASDDPIDTILINGVECEPLLTSDQRLMLEYPDRIMKGIEYTLQAFKAKRAVIAIKHKYQKVFEVLQEAQKRYPKLNIEIKRVGDYYPQGWEIELIKSALNVKIPVGELPSKFGIITFNVSTIVGIYRAVKHNSPVLMRNFTVSGDGIKTPANFRVRIGTPVMDLIEKCGGYEGDQNKVFIMGGPMMGANLVKDDAIITKTCTSVIVLQEKNYVEEPCVRCGSCVYSCPVGIQPVQIMNAYKMKDQKALNGLDVNRCIGCGLCTYACTSKIDVKDYVRRAKMLIK